MSGMITAIIIANVNACINAFIRVVKNVLVISLIFFVTETITQEGRLPTTVRNPDQFHITGFRAAIHRAGADGDIFSAWPCNPSDNKTVIVKINFEKCLNIFF